MIRESKDVTRRIFPRLRHVHGNLPVMLVYLCFPLGHQASCINMIANPACLAKTSHMRIPYEVELVVLK